MKFVLPSEFNTSTDALLLGEDEVRGDCLTDFVPPATFFWPTVVLPGVVDLDCFWVTTIKGFGPVVSVNPISCCACNGVTVGVVLEG